MTSSHDTVTERCPATYDSGAGGVNDEGDTGQQHGHVDLLDEHTQIGCIACA